MIKSTILTIFILSASLFASDNLVSVDGKMLTIKDADNFIKSIGGEKNYQALSPKDKSIVKDRLIEKELFAKYAKKIGIDKSEVYVNNLENIKKELLVNAFMKKMMNDIVVSDEEAKDYYNKHSKEFTKEATVHARHILVDNEKDAKSIISELSSLSGEALKSKFIELAKSKSSGSSRAKGGDLGTFSKGEMVPEFSKATWNLEVGKITTVPIKTQFGYHVIYLESKSSKEVLPYIAVKEKIFQTLKQKKFSSKMEKLASDLRNKAKITELK